MILKNLRTLATVPPEFRLTSIDLSEQEEGSEIEREPKVAQYPVNFHLNFLKHTALCKSYPEEWGST